MIRGSAIAQLAEVLMTANSLRPNSILIVAMACVSYPVAFVAVMSISLASRYRFQDGLAIAAGLSIFLVGAVGVPLLVAWLGPRYRLPPSPPTEQKHSPIPIGPRRPTPLVAHAQPARDDAEGA
jgi:hypothetical protein